MIDGVESSAVARYDFGLDLIIDKVVPGTVLLPLTYLRRLQRSTQLQSIIILVVLPDSQDLLVWVNTSGSFVAIRVFQDIFIIIFVILVIMPALAKAF